ncbi:MAG: glycosyltransferase [archaeon]
MKNKEEFVSIIIPCRNIDAYTRQCLKFCLELNYSSYEILLLPDKKEKIEMRNKKIRVIPTGKVVPAAKRNIGMKNSRAGIFAFIDSDAYPDKNWLRNAVMHLKNSEIGLAGGPNLTPKEDSWKQKISGMILASYFCSGRTSIRYKISKEQETIELPSCNFLVKKDCATKFEPDLLTAEDTKFCFNVWKRGKKVMYEPDITVYHHRRKIFLPHLKQIWIYARDVAMLLKRKGQFSLDKMYYSLLSLFVLGVVFGPFVSMIHPILKTIYLSVISLYLALAFLSSLRKNIKAIPFVFLGIIATHFAYGIGFMYGLISKNRAKLNAR